MRYVNPSRLLCSAIALLCLGGAGPATQPEPPADPKVLTDNLRREADEKAAELELLPSIGEKKIEDILVLDFEGPALAPRTLLTHTPRERSLTLEGMPGVCGAWLSYNRSGRPRSFLFERLNTSDPDAPYLFTTLTAIPGNVDIAYRRETIHSSSFIQLIDDRMNRDPSSIHPDGECRLYITVNSAGPTEDPLFKATIIEGDLPSLIHLHRTSADVYLRPMLRELGQERLMLPDFRTARQVLTAPIKVGGEMTHQVEQLVGQLDSSDFTERRSATTKLKELGMPGAQVLMAMDRTNLSTEQHNRVDEILNDTYPVTPAAAEKLRADKAFLIDSLELDDAALRESSSAMLQKLTGEKIALDGKATLPERLKLTDALRAKWLPPMEKMPADVPSMAGATTRPN